jgi:hypothetical protein
VAEDGTIEAIRIADAPGFALGVQWHAEHDPQGNAVNRALFQAFGQALLARKVAHSRRHCLQPAGHGASARHPLRSSVLPTASSASCGVAGLPSAEVAFEHPRYWQVDGQCGKVSGNPSGRNIEENQRDHPSRSHMLKYNK